MNIRKLYLSFIILSLLIGLIIIEFNHEMGNFAYILLGGLFITGSTFGLFTNSIFFGSAVIFPSSSESKIGTVINTTVNILFAIIGVFLSFFGIYKFVS